jgi:hypothetical protein
MVTWHWMSSECHKSTKCIRKLVSLDLKNYRKKIEGGDNYTKLAWTDIMTDSTDRKTER